VVRRMDPMSFSGIPDRRSCIIRPLLGVGREATYRYCMEKGIVPLLDPSNHDCRFARNRIRYHTIPALKSTFHPELDEHVLRLSSLVKGMERAEKAVLQEAGFQVIEDGNGSYYLLQSHVFPGVLTDSAIGRYLHMVTGRRPSRSLLREAVEHLHGRKRGRMSLPGGKVMDSDGERTYIYNRDQDEQLFMPEDAVRLTVPGRVRFERAGVIITAEYGALKELKRFPAGDTVLIGRKGLKEPLWVRRRHPGDRFVPLGTDGSKKLKDFFIDRKIPRRKRDAVPLVLDSGGEILWVAGVEISRKAALKGFEGEEAVVLRMEKSGHRTQGSGLSNNRIQNPEDCSQEED
jgi:tRNA(Ile)-lysidine synthase